MLIFSSLISASSSFQTNVIQHFVGQYGRKDGSRPLDLNGDRR
jgi:hypothetical protein